MTLDESECVRALSCEEIVAKSICGRVQRNDLRGSDHDEYDDHIDPGENYSKTTYFPHEAVCP